MCGDSKVICENVHSLDGSFSTIDDIQMVITSDIAKDLSELQIMYMQNLNFRLKYQVPLN